MRYGICTSLDNLELLETLGFDYLEASVTAVMQLSPQQRLRYREKLQASRITCEAFNILFPKTMELIGANADSKALADYLHQVFPVLDELAGASQENRGGSREDGGTSQENRGASREDGGASQKNRGASREDGGASQENRGGSREDGGTSQENRGTSLEGTSTGRVVVFGSGKCRRCPDGYDYRRAYRELVEVYRLAGEIAKQYGFQIVIEPLSRSETNLICTMAEGAILEADVNHSNVSLLSDYFHIMANHDRIGDIVTIGSFDHIHIAAGNGRFYPRYEEGEQYREFMAALKAIGYQGRISIEGKSEDIRSDGAAALALLKKLEAEV